MELGPILNLSSIQNLARPCIYALVHNSRRRVYLSQTTNLLNAISRLLKDLDGPAPKYRRLSKDRNNILLVVLENCDNSEIRMIHLKGWVAHYRNTGYRFYNRPKYIEYKTKIYINSSGRVEVRLVNRRNDFTCIETFDILEKAEEFLIKNPNVDKLVESYLLNPSSRMSVENDADIRGTNGNNPNISNSNSGN